LEEKQRGARRHREAEAEKLKAQGRWQDWCDDNTGVRWQVSELAADKEREKVGMFWGCYDFCLSRLWVVWLTMLLPHGA
jgi:hypothetical protein